MLRTALPPSLPCLLSSVRPFDARDRVRIFSLPLEGSSIVGRPFVVLVLSRAFSNEAGSLTATLQSGIALPHFLFNSQNVAATFLPSQIRVVM